MVLVHPIGGDVQAYRELAERMSADVRVLAIESPMLHDAPAPHSIDSLAVQYADALRETPIEGTLVLGGWSLGGLIAAAMAQVLGERCDGIVFVDSFSTAAEEVTDPLHAAALILAGELGLKTSIIHDHAFGTSAPDRLLEAGKHFKRLPEGTSMQDLEKRLTVLSTHLRIWRTHQAAVIDVPALYLGAGECHAAGGFVSTRVMEQVAIPDCNHHTILRTPQQALIAEHLCHFIDSLRGPI
ncbi:hypothetical protein ASG87_05095 [Frateuria sp. Soil773]|nr:hypothetical protein ASG87_05095 [Frateuria sp. Soil773]